jgi:hypothetical protein
MAALLRILSKTKWRPGRTWYRSDLKYGHSWELLVEEETSVADTGCLSRIGSWIRLFSIPDSGSQIQIFSIPDPGYTSKNLSILTQRNGF